MNTSHVYTFFGTPGILFIQQTPVEQLYAETCLGAAGRCRKHCCSYEFVIWDEAAMTNIHKNQVDTNVTVATQLRTMGTYRLTQRGQITRHLRDFPE